MIAGPSVRVFLFAIAIASAGPLFVAMAFGDEGGPKSVASASDIVAVNIASHTFRIPRAFIWSARERRGGKLSGVNLEALLPNLVSRNSKNAADFAVRGHGKKAVILVHENRGSFTSDRFLESYKRRAIGSPVKGQPEYEIYKIKESDSSMKELHVKGEPNGKYFFLYCVPAGARFSPGCSTVIDYSDDIYVSVEFSRDHMTQGEEIAERVKALLRSFESNLAPK